VEVANKVAVVTGGGAGIGAAIAEVLVANGANVVIADLNPDAAEKTARTIRADTSGSVLGVGADVSDTEQIRGLISLAENEFGPVEMYFANAGIFGAPGLEATEADWDLSIDVNLRAHIRAAQLLVPGWIERGAGYFVSTASAAGLLTQIGSATYSVTKHAAVGFAEWLSVTYGDSGVRVSCLCPMGVNTKLLYSGDAGDTTATRAVTSAGEVLEPAQVAADVLAAIHDERFLILPHANVLDMYRQKTSDYERWLRGMRRYQASLLAPGK
jgi:NAD(P)-dependent dehydrogenase (short-subunit alcohol dehydrogenase family)